MELSRRAFLAAGGALLVGLRLGGPARAQTVPGADRFLGKPLAPMPWIPTWPCTRTAR